MLLLLVKSNISALCQCKFVPFRSISSLRLATVPKLVGISQTLRNDHHHLGFAIWLTFGRFQPFGATFPTYDMVLILAFAVILESIHAGPERLKKFWDSNTIIFGLPFSGVSRPELSNHNLNKTIAIRAWVGGKLVCLSCIIRKK